MEAQRATENRSPTDDKRRGIESGQRKEIETGALAAPRAKSLAAADGVGPTSRRKVRASRQRMHSPHARKNAPDLASRAFLMLRPAR